MSIIQQVPWRVQPQYPARPKHGGVRLAYNAAALIDSVGATSTLAGSPSTVVNDLGRAIRIDSTAKSVAFTNRGPYFKESFNLSFVFTTNGSVLNGGTYLTLAGSSGSNNKIDIYTLSGTNKLRADIYSNAGSAISVDTADGSVLPFKSYVATLSYNRATNVSQWWINGTVSGSASTTVLRDNEAATVTFGGAGAGASGNIDLNFVGVEPIQNDGAVTKVSIWDRFFAPQARRIWVPAGAGGAYTITADAGAYTLAGQDAALVKTRIVTADAGSYAVGGQAASLLVGHKLTADAGAYAVAGQDATLLKSKLVTADAGAYTVAGQDATLAYTPTGVVYTLTADAGAYTVAGQDATLLKSKLVTADAGAYTVAGQDAVLLRGRLVTADAGAYTVAGQDATLTAGVPTTYVRNANLYLDIGSDLSIMLGNPRMPSWNTAGRPSAPLDYVYGFNTETNAIEVWTGSAWV